MSFKTRNTLVLFALWGVITAGGFSYWTLLHEPELSEIRTTSAELRALGQFIQSVDSLEKRHQHLKQEYESRQKEIPSQQIASDVYTYVSRGLDLAGRLKSDMRSVGLEDAGNWGFFAHAVVDGEGEFDNVYSFIDYIENGPRLYKIFGISLSQEERTDEKTKRSIKRIKFGMELHAYYSKVPELGTVGSLQVVAARSPVNPFDPTARISRGPPPGEIDTDRLEVRGIISGKAFVQYRGRARTLQLGDKVWRGRVTAIDPSSGVIEFTIEEDGATRKVRKRILFPKK